MDYFVFFVAALWAVVVAVAHDYQRRPPIGEENNIAIHLARGDGFINPLDPSPRAGPTAWSPPAAPYLMASVYRAWGIRTPEAITILMFLSSAAFGALVAGINVLGRIHFSSSAGLIAAGLLAIHPMFLYFADELGDTIPALAMFVWLLVAASRGGSVPFAALLGVAMGILSLTNSSYVFSYPLIGWHATRLHAAGRRSVALPMMVVTFGLALTPWTVRNYQVFGRLMYVRDVTPYVLWLGNQPVSTGLADEQSMAMTPYKNGVQREILIKIGELEYCRRCGDVFMRDLRADPWRFVRLTFLRAGYLFVGPTNPPPHAVPPFLSGTVIAGMMIEKVAVTSLTAVLGVGGIVLALRKSRNAIWLAGAATLAVLPFVITEVTDRYLLPLWAIFLLFGAYLIEAAVSRRGRSTRSGN